MAEAKKKVGKKVWSGYECPACFGVFRVPKGNEHREAICPRCETILHLVEAPAFELVEAPSQGHYGQAMPPEGPVSELVPGGVPHPEVTAGEGGGEPPEGKLVKKRRRKSKSSLDPDWERSGHARKRSADWKLPLYLVVGAVPLLGLVLIGLHLLNSRERVEEASPAPAPNGGVLGLIDTPPEESPVALDAGNLNMEEGEVFIASAREFLAAETLEEMLVLIRGSEEAKEKVRLYYEKHPYRPTQVASVGEDGVVRILGPIVSVNVVMDDYTVRAIALEKVDGRYLVDWESWVGYSEMEWEQFLKMNPRRSKEFRVIVSASDYYNYDFADDSQWKSYRITEAHHDAVIYGYLPRSSPMVKLLKPLDPSVEEMTFILKLRYPLETKTANQVLIEGVVASGWVLPVQEEEGEKK